VTWGIHQKSSRSCGAVGHGWPDDTYFQRLESELATVGVFDSAFFQDVEKPGADQSKATALETAYEELLSQQAVTDSQRKALQDMRTKEAEGSHPLDGCGTDDPAGMAAAQLHVLRLLQSWQSASTRIMATVQTELDSLTSQLGQLQQAQQSAMQKRDIPTMKASMRERAEVMKRRDGCRTAAEAEACDVAISGAR
jgi:hypothetical protein